MAECLRKLEPIPGNVHLSTNQRIRGHRFSVWVVNQWRRIQPRGFVCQCFVHHYSFPSRIAYYIIPPNKQYKHYSYQRTSIRKSSYSSRHLCGILTQGHQMSTSPDLQNTFWETLQIIMYRVPGIKYKIFEPFHMTFEYKPLNI